MTNQMRVIATTCIVSLFGVACEMRDDFPGYDVCSVDRCRVAYTPIGYQRQCSPPPPGCYAPPVQSSPQSAALEGGAGAAQPSPSAAGGAAAGVSAAPSATTSPLDMAGTPGTRRYSAFEIRCERDSQCGPGRCIEGDCYYGCHSDAQCGSGDRCAADTGTRICLPDPNPAVECTRTAQCKSGFACLDGACRQSCDTTEDCDNILDRCGSGVCLPDRRPLGECVFNSECGEGLVCLDGTCVAACAPDETDGVCLDSQSPRLPPPAAPAAGDDPPSSEEAPSSPQLPAPGAPSSGDDTNAEAPGTATAIPEGGASGDDAPANGTSDAGVDPLAIR